MSNTIIYNSKGVRITSKGAVILDGKKGKIAFANPQPGTDEVSGGIAQWGGNNLLPQEMAKDIEMTGVLSAGIDAKARIAIGKGPMLAKRNGVTEDGYEQLEFVENTEIEDWLELNNAFTYSYTGMRDLFGWGNSFTQILMNSDRTRLEFFKRTDPCQCRFEKINAGTGRINNVIISGDWSQYTSSSDTQHVQSVAMLDRDYPLLDLQSRKNGQHFMLVSQLALNGRAYYAPSAWYAAKKWVKIANGVPEMKEAMFKNQMTIKYVVEIHSAFWEKFDPTYADATDERKAQIQDEFYDAVDEYLVGGENAYKSLWSTQVYDAQLGKMVPGINVTVIDDKVKDGKLLPDSAAANIEILLPLMINAALLGVDMPGGAAYGGGAGSGSNIREAYLVQVMMVEYERQQISKVFNLAKRINNWDSNLVIRFPNQILTTLNTGKNTQPTA